MSVYSAREKRGEGMSYPVCLAEHALHAFPWRKDQFTSFESLFTGLTVVQVLEKLTCPLARLGAEKISRHRSALVQLGVRMAVVALDGEGGGEFTEDWNGELYLNEGASLVAGGVPRFTFQAGSTYIVDSHCRVLFTHTPIYQADFPNMETILHLCSNWAKHGPPPEPCLPPSPTESSGGSLASADSRRATSLFKSIRPKLTKVRSFLRIPVRAS